jgi:hypothetical protein
MHSASFRVEVASRPMAEGHYTRSSPGDKRVDVRTAGQRSPHCPGRPWPFPGAPRARGVFLAPVEDETGSGRYAVLAMTLNPRIRIVAGSLVLVSVGTKEQRPLIGMATHFHAPPYTYCLPLSRSC